jgi:hypothetical protein
MDGRDRAAAGAGHAPGRPPILCLVCLSPLLANVLLDEVDKELERRDHAFVCYADDANVYVRSRKAGERVMRLLRKLYGRLRLTINETKSAVASVLGRRFLGFSVWVAPPKDHQTLCLRQGPQGLPGPCPAAHALERRPQPRGRDRRALYLCPRLERLLRSGADAGGLRRPRRMDAPSAARHPAQALETGNHYGSGASMDRALLAMGAKPDHARRVAANSPRWRRNSGTALNAVLTTRWLAELGAPLLF